MISNSTTSWGWPAKALHWIGAAAILVLLVHGWWMTHMTARPERLANYAWHSALGYDLLALTVLRVLWRWFNPVPELPSGLKRWERIAAHVGHIFLYVLMFAVSVTGWLVATTFRAPMTKDFFGINLPPPSPCFQAQHCATANDVGHARRGLLKSLESRVSVAE
jgi:cytochrome b561